MQTKISLGMVIAHILALVSTGLVLRMLVLLAGRRGGAALLHVLGLAPLLQGLLGHVLLDVLALLPGHGVAHLGVDVAALLLVLELGHRGWAGGALLLGHLVTDLAGIGDVLANLKIQSNKRRDIKVEHKEWQARGTKFDLISNHLLGNLVADPAVDSLALPLSHLLGVDLGHEAAVPPGLLLAVPDGNLLAGLAVQLLAINLGHLDTLVLGLVLKCREK